MHLNVLLELNILIKSNENCFRITFILFVYLKGEPMNGEAFQKAVLMDKRAEVEAMLETPAGQRLFEIPDKMGNLPLQLAIIKNNVEMVELLIRMGADVNAKNDNSKILRFFDPFLLICHTKMPVLLRHKYKVSQREVGVTEGTLHGGGGSGRPGVGKG